MNSRDGIVVNLPHLYMAVLSAWKNGVAYIMWLLHLITINNCHYFQARINWDNHRETEHFFSHLNLPNGNFLTLLTTVGLKMLASYLKIFLCSSFVSFIWSMPSWCVLQQIFKNHFGIYVWSVLLLSYQKIDKFLCSCKNELAFRCVVQADFCSFPSSNFTGDFFFFYFNFFFLFFYI